MFGKKALQTDSGPLEAEQIPQHIAIIMDGNGRWAKSKGLPRLAGHKAGGDTLRRIVRRAGEVGVSYLSVYAFSTENWNRPQDEVKGLMKILVEFCKGEVAELKSNNTRIKFIGAIDEMPSLQREAIRSAEAALEDCTGMQLNICMNYGGRRDIIDAVKAIVGSGISAESIDEKTISDYLYTKSIPDPDLLIRTSGELRISNFYLWQLAYTEFIFLDKHWPELMPEDLDDCIRLFAQRHRRYGKI